MSDSGYGSSFSSTQQSGRSTQSQQSVNRSTAPTPRNTSNNSTIQRSSGTGTYGNTRVPLNNTANQRPSGTGIQGNTRVPLAPVSPFNVTGGNQLAGGDYSGEGNSIVCSCGADALLLTVRKEGPNTGNIWVFGCAFILVAIEKC